MVYTILDFKMSEGFMLLSLILLSYIDIKTKQFPAVLTTGILFVVALAQYQNLTFGILAFLSGWFLLEFEFFSGTADLKILTAIGLFIPTIYSFFTYIILILIVGTVYKMTVIGILKHKKETAFLPAFLVVFIILILANII